MKVRYKKMVKKKEWHIKSSTNEHMSEIKEISEKLGIKLLTAKLLYNRGYKVAADARSFLENEASVLHDPFKLADVRAAIERIRKAIEEK